MAAWPVTREAFHEFCCSFCLAVYVPVSAGTATTGTHFAEEAVAAVARSVGYLRIGTDQHHNPLPRPPRSSYGNYLAFSSFLFKSIFVFVSI